jgi:hypothetical protein
VATLFPSGVGAFNVVNTPCVMATTHATHTNTTAILRKGRHFAPCADAGRLRRVSPDCIGSSAIKRAAIAVAACKGQMLIGMLAMLRARLSVASDLGNLASLSASSHGSFPIRANTETKLRVMPFVSVPTGAKRNSFNPDCRKANTSELGMLNSYAGMDIQQDIV